MNQSIGGSLIVGQRFGNGVMARKREDACIEFSNNKFWLDTGCALHNECLTCPFEMCIHDAASPKQMVDDVKRHRRHQRIMEIVADYDLDTQEGRKAAREAAMATTGLSERTVRRHMDHVHPS